MWSCEPQLTRKFFFFYYYFVILHIFSLIILHLKYMHALVHTANLLRKNENCFKQTFTFISLSGYNYLFAKYKHVMINCNVH